MRQREKGETSKTREQKVQIHRARTAHVSNIHDLTNAVSHLSSVGPPQAVADLGGGNGDYWRGAGDTVSPGLAQEGP